jgi:hypothetical protein
MRRIATMHVMTAVAQNESSRAVALMSNTAEV